MHGEEYEEEDVKGTKASFGKRVFLEEKEANRREVLRAPPWSLRYEA